MISIEWLADDTHDREVRSRGQRWRTTRDRPGPFGPGRGLVPHLRSRQEEPREVPLMVFEESVVLAQPFDEALAQVKASLATEGFGTLTEIDVQATLKEKVGKEMGPYVIVGACNPNLASRALDIEPQIGVLLPCNVVVRQTDAGVLIEAMDPGVMAMLVGSQEIRLIADEARQRIGNALGRLSPAA